MDRACPPLPPGRNWHSPSVGAGAPSRGCSRLHFLLWQQLWAERARLGEGPGGTMWRSQLFRLKKKRFLVFSRPARQVALCPPDTSLSQLSRSGLQSPRAGPAVDLEACGHASHAAATYTAVSPRPSSAWLSGQLLVIRHQPRKCILSHPGSLLASLPVGCRGPGRGGQVELLGRLTALCSSAALEEGHVSQARSFWHFPQGH